MVIIINSLIATVAMFAACAFVAHLKNQSRLSLDVSVSNKNGEGYISCFACVMNDMGEITDTCFPRFICVCSKEEMDERLNELKEFIKKHLT